MQNVRTIYIKMLIAAAAIFVIGVCVALSDLYYKVISVEDALVHMGYSETCHHH